MANGGPLDDSSLDGTTHYYYEGWRVIEEYDVVSSVETLDKQLVYGNYLDEVWVVDNRSSASIADLNDGSGDDRVFAHANTQYSVHGLTNETGDLVEAYEYDPYGKLTVIADGNDGDSIVNFSANDVRTVSGKSAFGLENLYTGQRFDHETRNYYYKNRYYDPEIGRFLTRDPIGHWGDSYNFGNGYAYVGNKSVVALDMHGLKLNYGGSCKKCPFSLLPSSMRGDPYDILTQLMNEEDIRNQIDKLKTTEHLTQEMLDCMKRHVDKIKISCDKDGCDKPGKTGKKPVGYVEKLGTPNNPTKKFVIRINNINVVTDFVDTFIHELAHACGLSDYNDHEYFDETGIPNKERRLIIF